MSLTLVTGFGTALHVAPDGSLRHAKLASMAAPLAFDAGLAAPFPIPAAGVAQPDGSVLLHDGACVLLHDGACVLLHDGAGVLGAAADGSFRRCDAAHPAASLHAVDAALLADLRVLLGQRWAVPSRGVIAVWQAVAEPAGIRLCLGSFTTTLADLLASLRAAGAGTLGREKRLAVLHGGWQVTTLLLYRPLAWYAAFGPPDSFACLHLALTSLFEIGRWDGEAQVLTDPDHADLAATLPAPWRDRVRVDVLPAADMLDFALARYRVAEFPLVHACQPLLYLDIDVIADAPLRQLAADLMLTDALCICPERKLAAPEDYYGASIFAAEGTALTGNEIGFTTGLMGMRRIETAERAFRLVLRTAAAYPPLVRNRRLPGCYDQGVMNYVAHKLCLPLDTERLARRVLNMWHWLERPKQRRGLSHFTGGTTQMTAKRARMEAYLRALADGS